MLLIIYAIVSVLYLIAYDCLIFSFAVVSVKLIINKKELNLNKIELFLDDMIRIYIKKFVRCYTCDRYVYDDEKTVGHCFSRRHLNTRWDLDNIRLQCVLCNYTPNIQTLFKKFLRQELGEEKYLQLKARALQNNTDKHAIYAKAINDLIERFEAMKDDKNAEICRNFKEKNNL